MVSGKTNWEPTAQQHVIGRAVDMNSESYIIVGVLPEELNAAVAFKNVRVWTPLKLDANFPLRSNTLAVIGRLKAGIGMEQANREMQVVARNLESEFPDLDKGWSAMVTSLQEYGPERHPQLARRDPWWRWVSFF